MRSFFPTSSKLLLVILSTSVALSCKKEKTSNAQVPENTPEVSFVTDKQTYENGDTIKLINTSKNGVTFRWTLPNGDQINSANLTYITPIWDTPAYYLFKLDAFSENKTKSAHAEQVIFLKETQGKATFYTKTYFDTASISIDGAPYKKMVLSHSSSNNCDAVTTLTYSLKMGQHILEGDKLIYPNGSNYFTHWKYAFEIKPNVCNNIEAFYF